MATNIFSVGARKLQQPNEVGERDEEPGKCWRPRPQGPVQRPDIEDQVGVFLCPTVRCNCWLAERLSLLKSFF